MQPSSGGRHAAPASSGSVGKFSLYFRAWNSHGTSLLSPPLFKGESYCATTDPGKDGVRGSTTENGRDARWSRGRQPQGARRVVEVFSRSKRTGSHGLQF